MNLNLTGKTALITGGSKRIGRAIGLALAQSGANIIVHYSSSISEAERLAQEIEQIGQKAWTLQADLSVQSELDNLIDRACELAGPIDILVNNASVFPDGKFDTFTLDDLVSCLGIETWPAVALGRKFAEQCSSGHIVNMLDSRIVGYDWNHVAYHAAKSLLLLFTKEMALQFAPNIAVNAVAPGLILPPVGKDQVYLESAASKLPMKKVGDPEDIADAVLFLVSSKFITGQVIFVDGGRHIRESGIG